MATSKKKEKKNKKPSIPSAYMVVLRKNFALKDIKSSWRNADLSLSRKINEEWNRRGRREDEPPELKEVPVTSLGNSQRLREKVS